MKLNHSTLLIGCLVALFCPACVHPKPAPTSQPLPPRQSQTWNDGGISPVLSILTLGANVLVGVKSNASDGVPIVSTTVGRTENENHEAKWLAQHDAGIVVVQSIEGSSTIIYNDHSINFDEDPPLYCHQLKTTQKPILLATTDDRHHYARAIETVAVIDGKIVLHQELAIITPRYAKTGGFVFRRNENPIVHIGVIIPEVTIPPGLESEDQFAFGVSLGHDVGTTSNPPGADFGKADLDKLPIQPIDASDVVLMNVPQDYNVPPEKVELPKSARILWLKIGPNGSLEVDGASRR